MPSNARAEAERKWKRIQRSELQFARNLRRVAARCGALARANFDPARPVGSSAKVRRELENYGQALQQWAKATAERMVSDVARRDEKFWKDQSKLISKHLQQEIKKSPIGIATRERVYEASALISSLPLEAALRVEQYAVEYMTKGIRASELAKRVMETGEVTKSRANTIARTETSRTAAILQEVRAKSVGSDGYIWRTAGDIDVRNTDGNPVGSHRLLEGKFFLWSKPPVASTNGKRSHPGGIYNCFTPETLVAPVDGHLSVFRSCYSGPVVILILGETTLRVTPNHPILTPFGWKCAADIKEGDDVVNVPFKGVDRIEHNINDGLLSFGEIFEASSLTRKTTPFLVNGFYGDVVDEHVDIVVPELYLPSNLEPGVLQCLGKEMVSEPNRRIFGLAVAGRLPEIIEASFPGFGYDLKSLASRALEPELVGFADRTFGNAGLFKNAINSHACTTVSFAEGGDAFSGEVFDSDLFGREINSLVSPSYDSDAGLPLLRRQSLDVASQRFATRRINGAIAGGFLSVVRVTGKFTDRFTGHVFTSETATGYYRVSPLAILSKNCRCWAEVVLPGETRPRNRFRAEAVNVPVTVVVPAADRPSGRRSRYRSVERR